MHGKLFQLGYVVADLDAAMARLGETQDIRHFRVDVFGDASGLLLRSAKAYAGGTMLELLEPRLTAADRLYTSFLDSDPAVPRLQHLGYLVETEEEFTGVGAWMKARGIAVALEAVLPGKLSATYFDTRPMLGHYSEYVCLSPQARDFYDDVPANWL
ncbi:MAG: VOC family protein [Caulobacteraceae bacterium]|nr:VOC family protein [Caulobacteraceae bacterium]